MKVSIGSISRDIETVDLLSDDGVVHTEVVESDQYRIGFIHALQDGGTTEGTVKVRLDEEPTFSKAKGIVEDRLRDSIGY